MAILVISSMTFGEIKSPSNGLFSFVSTRILIMLKKRTKILITLLQQVTEAVHQPCTTLFHLPVSELAFEQM